VVSASVFHEDFVTTTHLKSKVQTALTTTVHKTLTAEQLTEESDLQPQSPAPDTETPYGQTFDVYLGLHPGFVRTLTEIKQHLVDILHQDPNDIEVHDNVVHMKLRADDFQTVAGIDEVRNIAEVILPEPCNNEARSVMNFPTMVTAEVTSTGALLEGTDQIVAVADTGFDMGAQAVGTAASPPFLYMFQDFQPPITPVNRIIALLPDNNRTSTDIRDKTKDTLCHGTFVCGNIAACGNGGNILPGPDLSHTLIKGTAPRARLVVQVCGDDNNMIVPNKSLKDLFDEAYYLGARTHNNSYATRPTGPTHAIINYASSTNHAQAIDEYTYGIDRQDMLVVFAAGNDGAMARPGGGIQTISDFALAKNCITVGACENRRFINYPATWYKFVDSGAPQCPYNMADFSSTGPPRTPQMRNKPDLVAPGACIYSTCTHDRGWPGYLVGGTGPGTANPISQYDRTLNGNSVDPNWTFNSGTSFSAPFVSGCAAVLREAILHKRHEFFFGSPWAVTIKALLVNGAVDLSDGGYPHNRGYLPGIPPDPFQVSLFHLPIC
jgi:serine protease AprX